MLSVYGRPGIAPACLRLQNVCGLDIPLFLAVMYAAAGGVDLNAEQIRMLDRDCSTWRRMVVAPLRTIRTEIKGHGWMTSTPCVATMREDIKALELAAERIEVEFLEAMITSLSKDSTPAPVDVTAAALLVLYCLSIHADAGHDDARLIATAVTEYFTRDMPNACSANSPS